MSEKLLLEKSHRVAGGTLGFYVHESSACGGPMRLAVFLPPAAEEGQVPWLTWLSGLTCTEQNFAQKAGAFPRAAQLGLALVMPDTSPRGAGYPGEDESWDFGSGAGFYLDALLEPWSQRYRMETYVTDELRGLLEEHFPLDPGRRGIFGHSMGGHGALTLALRHPELYRSVSALAPIVAPTRCPWGEKAFRGYLGEDRALWAEHDSCELIRRKPFPGKILVDQGSADEFLQEQLRPELLREACEAAGQELELRMQEGYDHSYYFVASFLADHLEHHARELAP